MPRVTVRCFQEISNERLKGFSFLGNVHTCDPTTAVAEEEGLQIQASGDYTMRCSLKNTKG